MKTWIDEIMDSPRRVAIPIMTHPGIEAIGKRVIDAVKDGQTHYEAIRYVMDHYNTYACSVIMDLTVEAEAFGCEIGFPENEVPNVLNRLVCDEASVDALQVPALHTARVPEYLRANQLAVTHITNRPTFAGCIGPFSLAGRLFDMSEIMVSIYMEPHVIHALLEKCTQFILDYCRELKRIGTTGVIMAEPAAGLLPNDECNAFSTDYIRRIVEELQDDSFTIILHNCGNQGQCTEAMLASGAKALHFGNAIDLVQVLRDSPENILIMGNIDPVQIMKQATPEVVRQTTLDLLNNTKTYPNFVLSSGCDVPPHTPEANLHAFFEALEIYNQNL